MKYPIGTKIIFTAQPYYSYQAKHDSGKTGVVVGYDTSYGNCDHVKIFIPNTVRKTRNNWTWITSIKDIKPAIGVQLLFNFMEDNNG